MFTNKVELSLQKYSLTFAEKKILVYTGKEINFPRPCKDKIFMLKAEYKRFKILWRARDLLQKSCTKILELKVLMYHFSSFPKAYFSYTLDVRFKLRFYCKLIERIYYFSRINLIIYS